MKNILKAIIGILILSVNKLTLADNGIIGEVNGVNLRKGEVGLEHIPQIINNAIDYLMGFAGTIAIIFVIIGAYKILFGSLKQDTAEGRNTIVMALIGFVIAALAYFIVKLILDNFS